MKVLSLFDGIACGREALRRIGIDVERYVAYEIEPSAIKIAKKNFPDIEERGDVFKADYTEFKGFDLLIGGSPCTNWSIAKAGHGRETTNSGIGWELFSQYIRAWKESGVKYYLYENNASMSNEIRKAISEAFGHEPLEINSALVSAQTRKRLYWTNIPGACVPEDQGIKLSSIIEHGVVDREKSLCLARRYAGFQGSQSYLCRRYFGKSMGQAVFEGNPANLKALYLQNDRFSEEEGEATGCIIRPMTVTECERLQTLPDGYTDVVGCSRVQRIEAIGNGWTVNVIVHLMQGLCNVDFSRLEALANPEIEPGLVYSSHLMEPIAQLTDKDCKELSDICEVCGTPIVNIKNAVADVDEKLHPICWRCDIDLHSVITLRDMMTMAGVNDTDELINWIENHKKYISKARLLK
jgi:DNA (cytosine-5)-methyltransferase 3A